MSGNRHVATKLRLLLVCSALHLGARATASAGQVTHSWCEPPEAVRAELDAIDRWGSDCMPSEDCWPSHMDTAKRLLAAYPDDLFVNRTYQDLVEQGSVQHRESLLALRAEYKARAEARPRDPVAQYLAGRIADNAAEERKFYEKALTLAPDFAWAHRGLARVEAQKDEPATRDQQFIKHELERFMTLCPNRPEAVLQLATAVDDGAFWQTHRASLRAAVKAENPHDQFAAWHGLWTLEFRMTPVGQHPQLREQVARDIEGIERLHLRDDPSWWAVLAHGFELTGDTQGKKQLNADLLQTHPCSTLAVRSTEEAFRSDHAIPSDAAPKEEKAHYEKTFYDATGKWLARCPDNFEFWLNRLGAIKDRPELPNEVVRADLDRIVQLWERNRGLFGMAESPYVVVSRIFLERNLEVERVPSLVEKEIELHHEEQTNYERIPDEEERGLWRIYESTQLARLKALEGRAELALGRRDAARKDLDTAAAGIEALRKPP
ncbi:MAG TPA: hypothetical protein VMT45_12580, partial [Thermoanaerobaculaceae bacterium]|nr:hypothetical protein [Thermoanaerobaculaceae bacterium]